MRGLRPSVRALSRSYPNDVFPTLGLWVAQPTMRLAARLDMRAVACLVAESAVLALPSRAESFGAVLVDALACGTPIVATRCGRPERIVRDDGGALVPPKDPRALAEAIGSVLARPDACHPERLREYVLSRFGLPALVERTYRNYLAVADARGRT